MFTFRRETGFLLNNSTSEQWAWRELQFHNTLLNPKIDLNSQYTIWFVLTFGQKCYRLVAATFGFMILSFVNGMIVRIALLCSNVVIFPTLYCMNLFSSTRMSPAQLAIIYQQMGAIGAYAAYLDRQGKSKLPYIMGLLATLLVFYFMQTSCQFLWTQILFPDPFAGHLNDLYFAYSNFLEFFVFIFIRTRSSIKYCAKYLTLANVAFLFYINSYMYAA